MITATRYHDFSAGHRVAGHESKCAYLHGHNYRIHFTVTAAAGLDSLGRVMDFSVINTRLCQWLEKNWDHKFLTWSGDEAVRALFGDGAIAYALIKASIVWVPFNPTAENMAENLLRVVGPQQLAGTGVELVRVCVEETRKCSAVASLYPWPVGAEVDAGDGQTRVAE